MFSLTIGTFIDIQASTGDVWEHLIDFPRFPDWNPMLGSVKADAVLGEQVSFRVDMPDKPLHLKAKINVCNKNRELRWAGGIPMVLRGEHYFALKELEPGKVRFYHGENFSGLLLPLLYRKLANNGPELYRSMNKALKQRVESTTDFTGSDH